jgi:uncharacterized protein
MAFIKITLVSLGLIYGTAVAGVYLMQRQLQYFPSRSDPAPETLGLNGVERQVLTTPDGETLVLWYSAPQGNRPMILFFHGNAGSIADRANRMSFYQSKGFGAAFLSYRGYGGSTGTPSEAGLITDAQAAYDHLRRVGVPASRIAVVGESLGTGVAVQLAARNPVAALVLEAPFSAAVDVAAIAYPWLPVRVLMKDQYRSDTHIGAVAAPLLILHGTKDQVIPYRLGQKLFAAAAEPKTFHALGPVGHDALGNPSTWAMGTAFLDGLFPP